MGPKGRWQEHKAGTCGKGKVTYYDFGLSRVACWYCLNPPYNPAPSWFRKANSRRIQFTRRAYKTMYHNLIEMINKEVNERILKPTASSL